MNAQMELDLVQVANSLSCQMESLLASVKHRASCKQSSLQTNQSTSALSSNLINGHSITLNRRRNRHLATTNWKPLDLSVKPSSRLASGQHNIPSSSSVNLNKQEDVDNVLPLNLVKLESIKSSFSDNKQPTRVDHAANSTSPSSCSIYSPSSCPSDACDNIRLTCDRNNNDLSIGDKNGSLEQVTETRTASSNEIQISSTNNRQRRRGKKVPKGTKSHLCNHCGRSFSRSDMLTRHSRLHSGLKPYQCAKCLQVFSRSDHLSTHERTHTGEKPYQCNFCSYSACRRDMITRHMRTHTIGRLGVNKTRRSRARTRIQTPIEFFPQADPNTREDDVSTSGDISVAD